MSEEMDWALAAEKLGTTPWDLQAASRDEMQVSVIRAINRKVREALEAVARDRGMPAGWAARVVGTDDYEFTYDKPTHMFRAVFAGEEIARISYEEAFDLAIAGFGDD